MKYYTIDDLPEGIRKRNAEKLKAMEKPLEKKQKYNSKGTWTDGLYFRSQIELKYYQELKLLKINNQIAGFILQPEFILQETSDGSRAITYKADFMILNNNQTFEIIDTKGYEPAEWKRTLKLFKAKYPNVKLKVEK